MEKYKALKNALIARLSIDLADKVSRLVPVGHEQ